MISVHGISGVPVREFSGHRAPSFTDDLNEMSQREAKILVRVVRTARDYLADLIEERFASRYKFCEAAGIDAGQLSRVFASRAELSLPALQKILHVLGAALVIEAEDSVEAKASPEEASRVLAAVTA